MPFQPVSTAPYTALTTNDASGHNNAVAAYGIAINSHNHDPSSTSGNYGGSVPSWGASNPIYSMHGPGGTGVGNDWSTSYNGTSAIPADPSETAINPTTNATMAQATPGATITQSWGIHAELARIRGSLALLKNGGNWWDPFTLYVDPLTTVGDTLVRNGSNVSARLGIGAAGQVLTVVSGLPAWQNATAGFADPTTTPGDMIYKNGVSATTRLPIGPTGYLLQVVGGIPTWVSPTVATAAAATTTVLGSVVVDQNPVSGNPIAITAAGYLTSLVNLTTANLSATAGITSGQIASVAATTITGSFTKAQQYVNTAYLDVAASFSSTATATALIPSGLTGATQASRYVGATTSGAPVTGTFVVGDFIVARNGALWVCTVAGSPGTWIQAGGAGSGTVSSVALTTPSFLTVTGSPVTTTGTLAVALATQSANLIFAGPGTGVAAAPTFRALVAADVPAVNATAITGTLTKAQQFAATAYTDAAMTFSSTVAATAFAPSGLTGATSATRYAGGTASGAPTAGTFAVGDYVIARDGALWVCTAAGTPGTWVQAGGAGGGSGTVNSVGLVMPSIFTVTGSPVTATGTLTAALAAQAASLVFAGPTTGSSAPTFRALTAADVPAVNATAIAGTLVKAQQFAATAYTDVAMTFASTATATALIPSGLTGATAASRYVGATTSGAPLTGTFAVGDHIIAQNGAIWVCTVAGTPGTWVQTGGGSVSSVALSLPSIFTVTGSPVTGSGTLTAAFATQAANLVLAGPSTGVATAPTFRALVAADVPAVAATAITGALTKAQQFAATAYTDAAAAFTSTVTATALVPSGLAGATAASRYVGGTTSGAPVSGTFAVGDHVIAQNGGLWVCTTAGSPGTWTQISGASLSAANTWTNNQIFTPSAGTAVPVTIKGGSAQSVPLLNMTDSFGNKVMSVDQLGRVGMSFAPSAWLTLPPSNGAGSAPIKFLAGPLLNSVEVGVLETDNGNNLQFTTASADRRIIPLYEKGATFTNTINSVSEIMAATMDASGALNNGEFNVIGRVIRCRLVGRVTTTTSGTFTVRILAGTGSGTTVIYNSGSVATSIATGLSNAPVLFEFMLTVRANGASSAFMPWCRLEINNAIVAPPVVPTGPTTVDMTNINNQGIGIGLATSVTTVTFNIDQVDFHFS